MGLVWSFPGLGMGMMVASLHVVCLLEFNVSLSQ